MIYFSVQMQEVHVHGLPNPAAFSSGLHGASAFDSPLRVMAGPVTSSRPPSGMDGPITSSRPPSAMDVKFDEEVRICQLQNWVALLGRMTETVVALPVRILNKLWTYHGTNGRLGKVRSVMSPIRLITLGLTHRSFSVLFTTTGLHFFVGVLKILSF